MNAHKAALIHHLTRELSGIHHGILVDELAVIGRVSSEVPEASRTEWLDVLDALISDGRVVQSGQRVAVVRERLGESSQGQELLF